MSMDLGGLYKLTKLMDLLLAKNRETKQEFYPGLLRVFFYIAEHDKDGTTLIKIQRDLGIVQTSVYRALAALGEGTSRKPEAGLGYIHSVRHPTDYRSKIIRLTDEGRDFLAAMTAAVAELGRDGPSTIQ